MTIEVEV